MTVTIAIPKEIKPGELRVAMIPALVNRLTKLGAKVKMQHNAGVGIHAQDTAYKDVEIVPTANALYNSGDIVLKIQPPTIDEVTHMKENAILIAFLYPHLNLKVGKKLLEKNITSFAMELVPRISRAQDMDALSSQATITGYKAVLLADVNHSSRFNPPC